MIGSFGTLLPSFSRCDHVVIGLVEEAPTYVSIPSSLKMIYSIKMVSNHQW